MAFGQLVQALQQVVGGLLGRKEWKASVAALTILQQCAEYVDDEATVGKMLSAVEPLLQDPHPRVRHAAWSAVGYFSDENEEVVGGDVWCAKFLPVFVTGFEDACERVAAQCMEAFAHFGTEVERENMEQVAQALMQKLGQRLQGSRRVQKVAIPAVGIIAGQIQDGFTPYFAPMMPMLKALIGQILHKPEERELLGKCFECVSVMAHAVGADLFKADAVEIMRAMMQATQVPNLPEEDPVGEYMLSAAERICSTMKGDFLPFVPQLLPFIYQKLAVKPQEIAAETLEDEEALQSAIDTCGPCGARCPFVDRFSRGPCGA